MMSPTNNTNFMLSFQLELHLSDITLNTPGLELTDILKDERRKIFSLIDTFGTL